MTVSVALVEGDDDDAVMIEELLAPGSTDEHEPVELTRYRSLAGFIGALAEAGADCALLDLGLPDAVGTLAVETVAERAPDLPIVVLTDSTDPRVARDAIRAGAQDYLTKDGGLDAELARRVIRYSIERAHQLRALRQSRQELHDFAHRIAHDLKSPMAVIVGSAEMLERRYDDDMARLIARSSRRLVDMVDRLLEYADTAGSDEMLDAVGLDEVVDWVVDTMGPELDDAELEVVRPLPTVHANVVGVRHVVLNLVSNALHHRTAGRDVRIRISATVDADGGVVVDVADDGPGIPAELRRAVFEPGFRVGDEGPRTGLGLATVRRSMGLVGGTVEVVDGLEGGGTTMRLRFPPAHAGAGDAEVS